MDHTEYLDRGRGARDRNLAAAKVAAKGRERKFKWEKRGLSRQAAVIAFCEELPITKGILRGKKMRLLPRQKEFIEALYSVKRGTRRPFNLAVKSEPKGNGKTGLVAALTLCHLIGPEAEDRGEVYSAAIDREQASLLFQEMVAILREVPEYMACVTIGHHQKHITVVRRFKDRPGHWSTYKALSKDAGGAHGLAPSLWVYDELAQTNSRELLDNLINGMGKRDDALGIVISTQAPNDDHALSRLIDEGISGQNPNTLVFLDAADPTADPWDPVTWRSCNPALGKFLNEKEFAIAAARAKGNPAHEASFLNLRLNQRVSPSPDCLITATQWKALAAPAWDVEAYRGKECIGGLDLSLTTDLSALVLVFPSDKTSTATFDIVPFFWTPMDKLKERTATERERFEEWIRRGFMTAIPGPIIRYDYIARTIFELTQKFKVKTIAYDKYRMAHLQFELAELGLSDLPITEFGQGHSRVMAPAIDQFTQCAMTGRLRHPGNAVLTASVVHAIVVKDKAGNPMLDKSNSNRSGPVRIDGAVALVMALGTAYSMMAAPAREFSMMFI